MPEPRLQAPVVDGTDGPRERIVSTAYELFARNGLHAVGVQQIIDEAGVAKATLYRHFQSKEELAIAVLNRRRELWTREWLQGVTAEGGRTGDDRLVAIFDALDDWFNTPGFEGCMFINLLIETHDRSSPIAQAAVAGLAEVRAWLRELAVEAGRPNPDALADRVQVLMRGAIVAAVEGQLDAARQARELAALMLSAGPQAG